MLFRSSGRFRLFLPGPAKKGSLPDREKTAKACVTFTRRGPHVQRWHCRLFLSLHCIANLYEACDRSKLLVYRGGQIGETVFNRLPDELPPDALLVFNNTRVIRARLLFYKMTGAQIEIFYLEPAEPADYAQIFQQTEQCSWHCLIGNLKKWKDGTLTRTVHLGEESVRGSIQGFYLSDNPVLPWSARRLGHVHYRRYDYIPCVYLAVDV